MRSRLSLVLVLICLALMGCSLSAQPAAMVAVPIEQQATPTTSLASCQNLVDLAVVTVGQGCDGVNRNEACYGNRLVEVDLRPDFDLAFNASGDRVQLVALNRLSTSPLDQETNDWGIAIIKAQANLPDALPGQNVTFLLFGDTTVDNPTTDMQAVTINTRITGVTCEGAPPSAVLLQSPEGTQVTMNINGADLTLASTLYLTATEDGFLTIATIEGVGIVTAHGVVRIVVPGSQVRLPLGTDDRLTVIGPPGELEPFDFDAINLSPLSLLDDDVTIPNPIVIDDPTPTATPTATATATAVPCTPRADWTARYVVQTGDTLSNLAQRLGVATGTLQAANCIVDPNLIRVGEALRVPFVPPTNTPTVAVTEDPNITDEPTVEPTDTPTLTLTPTNPNLRADQNPITPESCTTIRWDVDNVQAVYFEGEPVPNHGSQEVCQYETHTYTLLVVHPDGTQVPYTITIVVSYCGNDFCDEGENPETCPSDCGGYTGV